METYILKENQEFITFESIQNSLGLNNPIMLKYYLLEIFNDLSNKIEEFGSNCIIKTVFYDYFKFPIFIADKIFKSFANKTQEFLFKKEFVDNLFILYNGSFEETLKLIFNILDYDKDGKINSEDIKIFLSYLPVNSEVNKILENQMKSLEEINNMVNNSFINNEKTIDIKQFTQIILENNSEIFLQILCFLYNKIPFNEDNIEVLKIKYNKNKEEDVNLSNSKNKNQILINLPKNNTLLSPIKEFLQKYKIKIFSNRLDNNNNGNIQYNYDIIENNLKNKLIIKDTIKDNNKNSKNKLYSFKEGDKQNQIIKNISNHINIKSINFKSNYENWIYKITENGELIKLYLVLINKDIYFFNSNEKTEFIGMHNLTNCFIQYRQKIKILEDKKLYSFEIYMKNKSMKKIYYTEDKNVSKQLVQEIKNAIGYKLFSDYYEIKEIIGKGKYGIVNLGINKNTGEQVAIKLINKDKLKTLKANELILNEIDILKICHHPNVIKLIDHFEDIDYYYIILEYIKGYNLNKYLKNNSYYLTEKNAANIIIQIAKGIKYLHQYGIVHKDIKHNNIMITKESKIIKIIDLGISKILAPNESITEGSGTLIYAAPEILTRSPYNKEIDIWAMGILLYYMLSGIFPFKDKDDNKLAEKIVNEELIFYDDYWKNRSLNVKELIKCCLEKCLEKRIKIDDFMKHSWFKNNGIN